MTDRYDFGGGDKTPTGGLLFLMLVLFVVGMGVLIYATE